MPFGDGTGPRNVGMGNGSGRGIGRGCGQGVGGQGAMLRQRGRGAGFASLAVQGQSALESTKARLEWLQSEVEVLQQTIARLSEEEEARS